jgi:hypothetical protein
MFMGSESNTFGTSFLINRKYKQEIMNFEAVNERLFSLRVRGKFNNFTIILVHVSTEENDDLIKDSFLDKLNQIYQRIPAHDIKIIVGDFNAKIRREEVFNLIIVKWSLHETSN